MWKERIRSPVTWFVAPHVASLIGHLGEACAVYFCTDDHASMPNVDRAFMRTVDDILTHKADLVFVASDTLRVTKTEINPNTHYAPHGVDVAHFSRAQQPATAAPEDIQGLPTPIIGFFGLVERWIDLDLVAYLASQRPQWNFLMIGRVAIPRQALPDLPNIHFVGPRPYERLPDYGRHFSAAILPFRLTQEAFHANPLKLREYLAMGKPVVSVSIPEAERLADVIAIARTPENFLACLDKVVRDPGDEETVARRIQRVASSSWEARVNELSKHVEEVLARRGRES
jgi:glycosyltransferase involved in cell wall biosynthesis